MARIKEKKKILHQPSTLELFHCLADMPEWSKILAWQDSSESYKEFLAWLIQVNYKKVSDDRVSIKNLATEFKSDTARITKWIHAIYEDLLELNQAQPQLFQVTGIPVILFMKHYDNSCTFNVRLPAVSRVYERFQFFFMKAKMGTDQFWVKQINHTIGDGKTEVEIWLEGGFVNRYREMALDKAIFLEMISNIAMFDHYRFQIDDQLRSLPIHK